MGIEILYQTEGEYLPITMGTKYLKVGGYQIDVAARQQDQAITIDLSLDHEGQVVEGKGAGWYVANVTLPPAAYLEVETGEADPESGSAIMEMEKQPVNLDQVVVNVWALPPAPENSEGGDE
ncbi:hypothetical protein [Sediminispirochaeta bajacaliforniensis]|uniref:hypothetical protein n=1 Tax=Sediminispirochaeta bajacaliforniensis TaxID=148 RepID=UPI000370E38D|nr:hypothetical protein [Sediminispirochaeta bajacaliforniensis]